MNPLGFLFVFAGAFSSGLLTPIAIGGFLLAIEDLLMGIFELAPWRRVRRRPLLSLLASIRVLLVLLVPVAVPLLLSRLFFGILPPFSQIVYILSAAFGCFIAIPGFAGGSIAVWRERSGDPLLCEYRSLGGLGQRGRS